MTGFGKTYQYYEDKYLEIKMSGSELQGQEEAACTRISGLRDHYSKLFTRMVGLNF